MALLLFTATLFLSATLLFFVEPIFAKMALPVLGGSAAVWITCMAFFQTGLLVGCGFAHGLAGRMRAKWRPALAGLARDAGLVCYIEEDLKISQADEANGKFASTWVVMARRQSDLGALANDPRWLTLPDSCATNVYMRTKRAPNAGTAILSVRVPTRLRTRLEGLAKSTARNRSRLAVEALEIYVEDQEEQLARIDQGIRDADAGRVVPHEAVTRYLQSWGSKRKLPPPQCK